VSDFTVIGVPIDSVGSIGGTERAPAALRELGLAEPLGGIDAGDLDVRIRARSSSVAAVPSFRVRSPAPATRRAGSGSHIWTATSISTTESRPRRAKPRICRSPSRSGSVRRRGSRPAVARRSWPMRWRSSATVTSRSRRRSACATRTPFRACATSTLSACDRTDGRAAADTLGAGFWLHLDVDVLDERAFPATDYLMPGGLELDELVALMRPLASSRALVGASLGCYNPERDPGGSNGRALVELWRAAVV
jgi:hypothetical protein